MAVQSSKYFICLLRKNDKECPLHEARNAKAKTGRLSKAEEGQDNPYDYNQTNYINYSVHAALLSVLRHSNKRASGRFQCARLILDAFRLGSAF